MIGKSGGGDFVVIRATGTDAYNPYIYDFGGIDSVETIITKNRAAASDPFVVDTIRNAEALAWLGAQPWPGNTGSNAFVTKFSWGAPYIDALLLLLLAD